MTKEQLIQLLQEKGVMKTSAQLGICYRTLARNCEEAGIDLSKYKKKSGRKNKIIISN